MAVLLGAAALSDEGRVATLRDDVVAKRLVWGRNQVEPAGQQILSASSLFDVLGVDGRAKHELNFVAEQMCDTTWEACHGWLRRFEQRQLVQFRGNYIQVLPKPLAPYD